MRARLGRANRLLHVQDQLHRRAERDLAQAERRVQEVDAAQADVIRALNEASAFLEPLRDSAVRRLKSLAIEAQGLRTARDQAAQNLLTQATQHKRAERWVDGLEAERRQQAEKQAWAERLDSLVGPALSPGSSPGSGPAQASLRSARPDSRLDQSTSPMGSVEPGDRTCPGHEHPDMRAP